jgi:hypothetical protein
MTAQIQTYANHHRYVPAYHFFALPVLLVNVFVETLRFSRAPNGATGWSVIVAIALLAGLFFLRVMPLKAQDRVIRLEERTRLERLLPQDLKGRIDELTPRQLIALRFAPDDEVSELARRALSGELKGSEEIKRAIRNWRADHLRM